MKKARVIVVTLPLPKKTEHWLVVDGKIVGEVRKP